MRPHLFETLRTITERLDDLLPQNIDLADLRHTETSTRFVKLTDQRHQD